jgi:hypothetical protein
VSSISTYTTVLDVSRDTAEFVSRLPAGHRVRPRTRAGTRALGPFKQAILILRWFVDGTRIAQLARDNAIAVPTAYRYLHEGLTFLSDHAPDLSEALKRAVQAGYTHLSLDGTVVRTDRVAAPGPNGADLWWSGKYKHHGGNVQVISAPDGWPLWVSPVRPGREHDITCARAHGLVGALNRLAEVLGIDTLADLGYENAGPGFRHPVKRPKGGQPGEDAKQYNLLVRGVHSVAERANALLKVTFKALRRVGLDPGAITRIARAALVLLHVEHHRICLSGDHEASRNITEKAQ